MLTPTLRNPALRGLLTLIPLAIGCGGSGGGGAGSGGSGGSGRGGGGNIGIQSECTSQTGRAGTMHQGVISANETWTEKDSPHIITFDLYIDEATLTIEPCAEVRIREGYTITVGGTSGMPSALVAHGTSRM